MVAACSPAALAGQSITAIPAPAPVVEDAVSPWAVEVSFGYRLGLNKAIKSDMISHRRRVNQFDPAITGVYNIDEHNAVTLRFDYAWGHETFAWANDEWKINLNTWSIMPGYRYTYSFDNGWAVFAGANVGISDEYLKLSTRDDGNTSTHKNAAGFAYSVEVGGKYSFTPNVYAFATVQFAGNTAAPKIHTSYGINAKGVRQNYLGFNLGVGYNF